MDSNRRIYVESIIILPFLYGYCNIDTAKKCTREKNILHCKGRIKTSATIFFLLSFTVSESGLYISDLERPQKSGAVHHCTALRVLRAP